MKDFCYGLCKFVFGLCAGVGATILRLYVLVLMYTWFMLDLFKLPPINMIQMFGISLFWTLFNIKSADYAVEPKPYRDFFCGVAISLVTWLIGYVLHSYV